MAPIQSEIARELTTFLVTRFKIAPGDRVFTPDVHLFDQGYVDSTGLVELIAFVETTYGLALEQSHLASDEFATINGIARIILGAALHP